MSEQEHECFTYCCLCRYSIAGSGGWYGKEMLNKITGEKHYYCYTCYPKAVDIYIAELKLNEVNK